MSDVVTSRVCQQCNGEISTEQIVNKSAGLVQGVLLCPECVEAKRKELIEAHKAAAAALPPPPTRDITDEKLDLIDELEMPKGREAPKIMSFAQGSSLGGAHHESELKRKLGGMSEPATRCRTFHSKLTPGALAHMDDLINQFLDQNPGTYVKLASTTVGMFEAKHPEPHLIMTILY